MQQIAKIDFIICVWTGSWYNESICVPREIAVKSNEEIVKWVKAHNLIDKDAVHVGVYWRDPNIDEAN